MKACPKCGTVYTDDTLSFCLSDGTPLPDDLQGAKTEILPKDIANMETVGSRSPQTEASFNKTDETIVRSTKESRRNGVSPFWIVATFGLLGIVLAGFIVGWLVISNRNQPETTSKVVDTNKNESDLSLDLPEKAKDSTRPIENLPTPSVSTPKPTSTPSSNSGLYRIVGVKSNDVLYIRPSAGNLKIIVGKIPPNGTGIKVTGSGKRVGKNVWVPISYEGKRGWVNSRYLAKVQ